MSISIRPILNTDEIETCARMMAASEPWITLGRDYAASRATLTHPDKDVFVAIANDQIAGFVIINMHGALVGYIQSICIAETFRGHGVGSHLMQFAEEQIFRTSANAFIMVSSFNDGARRLYERSGYHVVGELTDFIIKGHSEILLRKTRPS